MTLPSHAWCRQLAEANLDALGAVLRGVAEKYGPGLEILPARELWEGDEGTHWFLHLAVVVEEERKPPLNRIEDDCVRALEPWTGKIAPIVHVYAPNDPRVKRYHRVGPNVPRPVPQERPAPPPAPVPSPAPAPASPVAPKPTRKPPTQGSLF